MIQHLLSRLRHLRHREASLPTAAFEWTYTAFLAWFMTGLYIDGWAHHHLDSALETFFTPWHGIFYSGFFALAMLIGIRFLRRNIPRGYELSALGVAVFMIGGAGDMLWHIIFGIEESVEALLSPTHLWLAIGAGFIVLGPLRAAWHKTNSESGFFQEFPAVLSLTLFVSLLSFMTQFAHMAVHPWPAAEQQLKTVFHGQALGISNVLIQTAIMMGMVLFTLRRWHPPVGTFTVLFGLQTLGLSYMEDQFRFIIPGILAGVAADILYARLRPYLENPLAFRSFAFALPVLLYLGYFGALFTTTGVWWSIHLWTGSIVISGIIGWLLSYLVFPPQEYRSTPLLRL